MSAKDIFPLLKETAKSWSEDKAPRLAAALAYYTVFSIAPLVLVAIAIAGLVLNQQAASQAASEQLQNLLGPQAAGAVESFAANTNRPGQGIIAATIGTVILLFGAAGVFNQLKDALNTVWEVEPKPSRGVWGFIKDQLLSIGMVLGIGFLLLVSLLLSAAVSALTGPLRDLAPGVGWLGIVLDLVVSLVVVTLLFALIFKILPDAEVEWRDVWIGAFGTAALFAIGKLLIGLYLGRSSVASAYGAAGSLVVLLLWVYYSAQILLFGAEFTQVYAQRFGSRIVPEDDAVAVTDEARAQQGMPRRESSGRRGVA